MRNKCNVGGTNQLVIFFKLEGIFPINAMLSENDDFNKSIN